MFAEIRNDYIFGPAVEPGDSSDETGLFAGITIDGWKTGNDDEEGHVIAQVLMSAHGDTIVAWHDNGARMDEEVLSAIKEAKKQLNELWAEKKASEKYIYLKDSQGDMDLILVHNWDEKFQSVLNHVYESWRDTQSDNHGEIYPVLRDTGYNVDVVPCDVIIPGEM